MSSKILLVLALGASVCVNASAYNGEAAAPPRQQIPEQQKTTESATTGNSRPGSRPDGPIDYRSLHNSALVIDTHADTTARFTDEKFDPSRDAGNGHWDLKRAKEGNLGAEFFSIYVDPERNQGHYARRALDMIDSVYQTVRAHPDDMVMAFSTADIVAARGSQPRIASLLGIEGGHAIEGDMRLLRDFYRLGVRYMTLTWSNSNELGQSSGDPGEVNPQTGKPNDRGLTSFGLEVVREMNRLGMMVDISHVSDQSFYDALKVSRAPVIASHSSARALTDSPRNLTDDMLIALAHNGGVAQANFFCGFIDQKYLDAYRKLLRDKGEESDAIEQRYGRGEIHYNEYLRAEQHWAAGLPQPPIESLIDHIDHMVKVAGIDHVGLGSDFDGVYCLPRGLDSVADLPKITQALVGRGYSADDVRKILGGNLLRVFAQVEEVSREMQGEPAGTPGREMPSPPARNPQKQ